MNPTTINELAGIIWEKSWDYYEDWDDVPDELRPWSLAQACAVVLKLADDGLLDESVPVVQEARAAPSLRAWLAESETA
jgi:hypothetical protein